MGGGKWFPTLKKMLKVDLKPDDSEYRNKLVYTEGPLQVVVVRKPKPDSTYRLTCTKEGKTVINKGFPADTAHEVALQVYKIREQFNVHSTYSVCCEPWPWWVEPVFWLHFVFMFAIIVVANCIIYWCKRLYCQNRSSRLSQCSASERTEPSLSSASAVLPVPTGESDSDVSCEEQPNNDC